MEEVCIIGGGIAGIISAKVSLTYNLKPVVFEKSSRPGGIWVPDSPNIGIWSSLQMNLSKFIYMLSDQLWPEETPTYPSGLELSEYLASYVSKHNLLNYFQLNTKVLQVEKQDQEGFSVTYLNADGTFTKYFKYVLIATGQLGRPNDCIKNKELYNGKIVEPGYYREPSVFSGKNVTVIGMSYSAGDISCEALKTAKSVTQIFRKKVVFNRRFYDKIPYDFYELNFQLLNETNPPLPYTKELCSEFNHYLVNKLGNPGDLVEECRLTPEEIDSDYIHCPILKIEYLEAIKEKKIQLMRGDVLEYVENGVLLRDGQIVESDIVVPALGYFHNLDFLGDKLKEILKYDKNDRKFPVLLFRNCIHPDLPGLAFVGNIYTVIASMFEISANIGVRWVKGLLNVSQKELWEGVRLEERLRVEERDAMWAYDFIGLTKECLRILEISVEEELLQSLEYRKGPLSPVFFFRDQPGHDERIREYVRQIKAAVPEFEYN